MAASFALRHSGSHHLCPPPPLPPPPRPPKSPPRPPPRPRPRPGRRARRRTWCRRRGTDARTKVRFIHRNTRENEQHVSRLWSPRRARAMQVPSSSEGGDDRPTFFELIAADKLVPSLRAALVYSVGVLVSRRPSLARLLDHEDEAFALFMLLVEWHSFATSDGSLAEGLYGLQRTRARLESPEDRTRVAARAPRERRETHHQGAEDRVRGAPRGGSLRAREAGQAVRAPRARARPRARHGRGRRRGRYPGRGRGWGRPGGDVGGDVGVVGTRRRRRGVAGDAARADARVRAVHRERAGPFPRGFPRRR